MVCCKCSELKWEDPQEPVWTDPADGKEYCVFHAPKEHKQVREGRPLSVDEFNALISERIQATVDSEEEGARCDLRGVVFPGDICFEKACPLPAISFHHARFEGAADFDRASFRGAANFIAVRFGGEASFWKASFGGEVVFGGTSFGGRVVH